MELSGIVDKIDLIGIYRSFSFCLSTADCPFPGLLGIVFKRGHMIGPKASFNKQGELSNIMYLSEHNDRKPEINSKSRTCTF